MYQNRYNSYNSGLENVIRKDNIYESTIKPNTQFVAHYSPKLKHIYSEPSPYKSIINDSYQPSHASYSFMPEIFLKNDRPFTRFVNTSEEVRGLVEETFSKLTGRKLPDVSIRICTEEEMMQFHPKWHKNIVGFAMHKTKEVFIKNDSLDRVLITIGHEIGHVFTNPLDSQHNEEAKAFAFEFAWVKSIRENNIGELSASINPFLPAENGLHNVAFNFVLNEMKKGKEAMVLHWDLVKRYASINNLEELV